MTLFTESYTVGDVKSKFWIFRERFDMMSVEIYAFFATVLASIFISFIDLFTPIMVSFSTSNTKIKRGFTTLPIISLFAYKPFSFTSKRTKRTFFKAKFMAVIRLATKFTNFIFTFSEMSVVINWFKLFLFCYCATFLATIKFLIDKRRINIKSLFTNRTGFVNAFSSASISTFPTTINSFINKVLKNIKSLMANGTNFINTLFHYYNFNIIEGENQLRREN